MGVPFFQAEELTEFWNYVGGLCETACPPRFRDFDLMEIYVLARNITILDTDSGFERLLVRYAGINVVEMFGRETTGLYMDEIDLGNHKEDLLRVYRRSAREGIPFWTLAQVKIIVPQQVGPSVSRFFAYERLVFPFQDGQGGILNLVSLLIRHPAEEMEGFDVHQLEFPCIGRE